MNCSYKKNNQKNKRCGVTEDIIWSVDTKGYEIQILLEVNLETEKKVKEDKEKKSRGIREQGK